MTIHIQLLSTPAGDLLLGDYQGSLCLCDWMTRRNRQSFDNRLRRRINADYTPRKTPLLKQAIEELQQYFAGERQQFAVPISLYGTDFQRQVWQALQAIPYGQTTHYQQLAYAINRPKSVRAVANAIGANPISIVIPCHRVIGKNKQLTGYAGGIGAKRLLLNLEYREQIYQPILTEQTN